METESREKRIEQKDRVQVLERAFDILEYIASTNGCSVLDIAKATGYPMPTVYRILHTLENREWVTQQADTKKYFIGSRSALIGSAHNVTMTLITQLHPQMEALTLQFHETICLGMRVGSFLQYVAQVRSLRPIEVLIPTHTPLSLYSTASGKLLLSDLPDVKVKMLLEASRMEALTENTVTDSKGLLRQLAHIRKDGYAMELGESIIGMGCLAVPVYFNDRMIATLTFAGVAINKLTKERDRMLKEMHEAKSSVEALLRKSTQPISKPI